MHNKTYLIIGAILTLCTAGGGFLNAHAQKDINATHMWLRAGDNLVFAPVSSLEQCRTMTSQAANINSSEADCYSGSVLVGSVKCVKSVKRSGKASCS